MIIVGVDPGASGGIATNIDYVDNLISVDPVVMPMPETEGDLVETLRNIDHKAKLAGTSVTMFLEHVSGFSGKEQPGSRMFNFGKTFWGPMFAAMALGWRVELVRPQKWMKHFGLGTKSGSSGTEWKNKLKAEAQRRYPNIQVTLKTADALLIMDYGVATWGMPR